MKSIFLSVLIIGTTSARLSAQYSNFHLRSHGGTPQAIGIPNSNTSFGLNTLLYNNTGTHNAAFGHNALSSNTIGTYNTAMGSQSLLFNTTGHFNTATGSYALFSNTTGSYNTGTGNVSLYLNTTGYSNTAYGQGTLYSNTSGSENTALGTGALYTNTTGYYNVASGVGALNKNSTGIYNHASGTYALFYNMTGHYNTAVGSYALIANTTGSNNTALGGHANVSTNNLTNATAIGYGALVDASNKVVIGNAAVTVIGGAVSWSTLSDKRYKKNIKTVKSGLAFILGLKPVLYQYDKVKLVEEDQKSQKAATTHLKAKELDQLNESNQQALKEAEKGSQKIFYGLLAQDVHATALQTGYEHFSGIVQPEENGGKYALRYAEFVMPLIGAVQEQDAKMDDLKKEQAGEITQLKKENEALKQRLNRLEELMNQSVKTQKTVLNGASMEQNVPNPFQNTTKISYFVPEKSVSAKMMVYNSLGALLQEVPIQSLGKGELELKINGLPSGTYTYSLIVDGQVVETKKMLLTASF